MEDEEILTYGIERVGMMGEKSKTHAAWDINFTMGNESYWKRKQPLVLEGFEPPAKEKITTEFYVRRQLYEMVGRVGQGRVDTGEFDFANLPPDTVRKPSNYGKG